MAESEAKTENPEEEKKGGKGKLILFAVAGLLLLGGGGGAAAYFLGMFGGTSEPATAQEKPEPAAHGESALASEPAAGESSSHETQQAEGEGGGEAAGPPPAYFVELPDILVNLRSNGRRMRFLKLRVALEVADPHTKKTVEALTPRVMDSFQLYLRALTVDELRGAGGLEKLKEELIARVNRAIRPNRVDDVLFKEMLVQ